MDILTRKRIAGATTLAALALGPVAARATCPTDIDVAVLAAAWPEARAGFAFPPALTEADAACVQEELIALLSQDFGPQVGWKLAATNPVVMQIIGGGPTRGALFERMLVSEGQALRTSSAASIEADLLLRVRDEGINDATTPLEILAHISEFIPFIESPYTGRALLTPDHPLSPVVLTAINSAARIGVVGTPVPVDASWAWVTALGTMDVVVIKDGTEVARNDGAQSLGNPLLGIAWLIGDLRSSGKSLRAGDLISTGSFSPLMPFKAGESYTVRYEGLPTEAKTAEVSVTIE